MVRRKPSKREIRARGRRNVIRGLVEAGTKMNVAKASPFTQEQFERKRYNTFSRKKSAK